MNGVLNDELRTQAARIRAAVIARHGDAAAGGAERSAARLDGVNRLARVSAHWGIASETPLLGPLLVLWRRALRIALRWYINPIVEQQNAFNQAVARALLDLEAQNEELRIELAGMRTQHADTHEHSDSA